MGVLAAGSLESVVQLITSLLIFAFVLVITFWTSKFIARYQKQTMSTGNLEVMEATRIAPNKYLQIVRAGDKYLLIAIGKETVSFIAELSPESLEFKDVTLPGEQYPDFRAILEKAKNSMKKQAGKDE